MGGFNTKSQSNTKGTKDRDFDLGVLFLGALCELRVLVLNLFSIGIPC